MDSSFRGRARVGHSPDPDDAFMFHGIASGKVDTDGFGLRSMRERIETLGGCFELDQSTTGSRLVFTLPENGKNSIPNADMIAGRA